MNRLGAAGTLVREFRRIIVSYATQSDFEETSFAHSRKPSDNRPWQGMQVHLNGVALLAMEFAPRAWRAHARLAGLWHDLGKYQQAFQAYIQADPEASNQQRVPHAIVGATLAWKRSGMDALPLALAIQAHHSSLQNQTLLRDAVANTGTRLLRDAEQSGIPADLLAESTPPLPSSSSASMEFYALATRFLFSSLVDADSLDTERWDRGEERDTVCDSIPDLAERVELACRMKSSEALAEYPSALNRMRAQVFDECLASASLPVGSFTLTVPTGGGKTLSGLAFALRHAAEHGLHRVIVVAPYTSILEQVVKVYRHVLGERNVIEHHSNIDLDKETDRNRAACENWDAPVIVTTSVQFFETLYAARKSRCRKLHRIGRSVVFLDEVQTFPETLLKPIHAVLDLLTGEFGTSVVHSTATQPRLMLGPKQQRRLKPPPREIVPSYREHFPVVKDRFTMEVLSEVDVPVSMEALASAVGEHATVLAIVHRRQEAEMLARSLGPECLHLSARMCAEHRTTILDRVRQRLKDGEPCRLVATQLVEAGVDLDFPVVFRALAGLETLAQAAGRCNRELRLPQPGRFIVFCAPSKPPAKSLERGLEQSLNFFKKGLPNLADPDLFAKYSKGLLLGLDSNLDAGDVLPHERLLDFPEVEKRFHMIDDSGAPVVADYGDAWKRVRELRANGPSRTAFRRLQRYTVSLLPQEIARLQKLGVLEPLLWSSATKEDAGETYSWVLKGKVAGVYDERFGFSWQGGERVEPETLIV